MSLTYKIFFTIIIFLSIRFTFQFGNYNPKIQPKLLGTRLSLNTLDPKKPKLQQKIVLYHNYFRLKVRPPAANMLKLKWHNGAAKAAQRWASACTFLVHDNVTGRHIDNYGACGQNIFVSTHKVPWFFAIKTWWLEKDLFTYGRSNNLTIVGHYTQMVWAATHEVGCGIAECSFRGSYNNPFHTSTFYNYVCNYCPIGNRPARLGRPYIKGKPCSLCKRHCGKHKLCLNPCYASDQYTNCRDLSRRFHNWLCNSPFTAEGRERRQNCLATCTCRQKIHD